MRNYWSWDADEAYKEGQRDAERGTERFWEFDRYGGNERDQAYYDGQRDYERQEEQRREEREQEERQQMREMRERQERQEYESCDKGNGYIKRRNVLYTR